MSFCSTNSKHSPNSSPYRRKTQSPGVSPSKPLDEINENESEPQKFTLIAKPTPSRTGSAYIASRQQMIKQEAQAKTDKILT